MFNLGFSPITELGQLLDQIHRIDHVSDAADDRVRSGLRIESLHQRAHRSHDDRGRRRRVAHSGQQSQSPAHRFDRGTHAFERQCSPSREERYLILTENRRCVVGQSRRFAVGGRGDEDRATFDRFGQPRHSQCPSCLGDDEHRVPSRDRRVEGRLRGEQRSQLAKVPDRVQHAGDQLRLNKFIAASRSLSSRNSTASAAQPTTRSSSGRSLRLGRFST